MDIYFLSLEEVLVIHQSQINNYGGAQGLRDKELLLCHTYMPKRKVLKRIVTNFLKDSSAVFSILW